MADHQTTVPVELCADGELGYERSRTRFAPGQGLALDEACRLAHLPLVAPGHPDVIAARDGAYYDRGRHPRVFSLVLPVPWQALSASVAYQELDRVLRASLFAPKIAWNVAEQRRDRLHATLCGSLAVGQDEAPAITGAQRRELARLGPVHVELRGLFSGNVNVGRLYLRAYPERRDGANLFRQVQRILGRRETDLYVVGLHNLTDGLTGVEASELAQMIEAWWDRPVLRFEASQLWMLWATDDLVLEGGVAEEVPLTA